MSKKRKQVTVWPTNFDIHIFFCRCCLCTQNLPYPITNITYRSEYNKSFLPASRKLWMPRYFSFMLVTHSIYFLPICFIFFSGNTGNTKALPHNKQNACTFEHILFVQWTQQAGHTVLLKGHLKPAGGSTVNKVQPWSPF